MPMGFCLSNDRLVVIQDFAPVKFHVQNSHSIALVHEDVQFDLDLYRGSVIQINSNLTHNFINIIFFTSFVFIHGANMQTT